MNLSLKIKNRFDRKMLKEVMKNMAEVRMRVGWEKDQKERNGMTTAEVAYLNEVGHWIKHKNGKVTHVVARPFMELACEENQRNWHRIWRTLFRQYMVGERKSLFDVCHEFCQQVIQDVRAILDDGKRLPENEESTLRAKKSRGNGDKPLIDYGTMRDSLTEEILINR